MKNNRHNKAFTLVEVMLAAAILVIGLMLVAGAFPVGIKLTAISTERVIGSVVAQEAAAKIQLFGKPNDPGQPLYGFDFANIPIGSFADFANLDYPDVLPLPTPKMLFQDFDPAEFWYPSTADASQDKLYHWSALIKKDGPLSTTINAVVFVSRISNPAAQYLDPTDFDVTIPQPKPIPVLFDVTASLTLDPTGKTLILGGDDAGTTFDETTLFSMISDGASLVTLSPDAQGNNQIRILNVIDRQPDSPPQLEALILADGIPFLQTVEYFWVIPSADGSSRNPCIAVYPQTFTF
jgi:prepilin-type N-terminal cleavage/methylation domain-containing protein